MGKKKSSTTIADNRKASHKYQFIEKWEAGLVLKGYEVKSVRMGRVNLGDAYVRVVNGEAYVVNLHISAYSNACVSDIDPTQQRKLLLHKSELEEIIGGISRKGLTCVPTKMYFKRGIAKLQIALSKGKDTYDKRQDLKKKDHQREMDRARKQNR
jgi:SsrA-binding protein